VLEDDEAVREVVKMMLESLGYSVLSAGCPEEARRVLEERGRAVNLLLSDVVLPDVMGPAFYDQLRDRYPSLKALFMSGHDLSQLDHGSPSGGRPFLRKPVTLGPLGRKLREALGDV
jgi:two-component system cell cycle sensor histidine kinase/response regulator CckA